jgi:hypothetical protein
MIENESNLFTTRESFWFLPIVDRFKDVYRQNLWRFARPVEPFAVLTWVDDDFDEWSDREEWL